MRSIATVGTVAAVLAGSLPAAADEWDGLYAGIQALYGRGQHHVADDNPAVYYDVAPSGMAGGGQIGYRIQRGAFVFGAVADAAFGDLGQKKAPDYPLLDAVSMNVRTLASGRLLAGYALPQTLVYATGGIGWGRWEEANYNNGGQFGPTLWQGRTGWVAGIGVERALGQNVSLGLEYLHYDFGSWVHSNPGGYFWGIGDDHFSARVDSVRVALNYRFGGPPMRH